MGGGTGLGHHPGLSALGAMSPVLQQPGTFQVLPWWSGGGGQLVVGETTSVTWQAVTEQREERLLLLFSPSFFQSFANSSSLWRVVPER